MIGSLSNFNNERDNPFITGALLGGGSKGMHKIIDSFLSAVEKYRRRVKDDLAK